MGNTNFPGDVVLSDGGKLAAGSGTSSFSQPSDFTTDVDFDFRSESGAMTLPGLTTAVRDALTPTTRMFIYNTTTNTVNFYNGTAWKVLAEV